MKRCVNMEELIDDEPVDLKMIDGIWVDGILVESLSDNFGDFKFVLGGVEFSISTLITSISCEYNKNQQSPYPYPYVKKEIYREDKTKVDRNLHGLLGTDIKIHFPEIIFRARVEFL